MAVDMYLKIDGIDGESTDDKHKKWIEVLSFGSGVSQPVTGASATGGRSGARADFQDLSVLKTVDNASPDLLIKCAKGEHIKKVELECCLATGSKHTFLKYTLENCLLTAVQPSGSSGGAEVKPSESVSFAYGKIKIQYTPIDHTGKPGSPTDRTWSLEKNKQE
jgi:type VI secretion system secreted protein Hcp